ncbi:MAG TPA: TetR/AcrR family transcriptional regulator, partial [Kofleriaceae bacterium]|nr:TetR/AcrR family transcriptional regulator [Kofleriaceae bacterium]
GRPRDEEARVRIVEAAVRLAREDGLAGLTMEGIAAEAGVGKQTVYRWWSSCAEVLVEGLRRRATTEIPLPRPSRLSTELETFLASTFAAIRRAGSARVLGSLMAEAQRNDDFRRSLREWLIDGRRAALLGLFERARTRGELASGFDPELGVDLAFGVMWYRLLIGHAPLDDALARSLAGAIARAARSR